MRLISFTVKNFRSIIDAYKLPLRDFAVLVGPNNEGKSNILRGIVTALRIIAKAQIYLARATVRYRYLAREDYNWERDFPVALQEATPEGTSDFTLEFELEPKELKSFNEQLASNLSTNLKLKLSLGRESAKLEVLLQGKTKKHLTSRSEQIARFVAERLDIQYIPAIRPSNLAVEAVQGLLDRALGRVEDDPAYQGLIDGIEAIQRPLLDSLGAELTKSVSSFVPEVKQVILDTETELRQAIRRSCRVKIDDGTLTDLSMKGDGIKSLTAISLMRHTGERALGARSLILAIEEPESHLHPHAIHRLREVLQEIASSQQVIITTHSPILVDRAEPQRNIVVRDGKAVRARHIREVREALGVQLSD